MRSPRVAVALPPPRGWTSSTGSSPPAVPSTPWTAPDAPHCGTPPPPAPHHRRPRHAGTTDRRRAGTAPIEEVPNRVGRGRGAAGQCRPVGVPTRDLPPRTVTVNIAVVRAAHVPASP